jgi:hypothetical protein
MQIRNSRSRFLVVAAALAVSACATTSTLSASSAEDVKRSMLIERADARGMALVQGDLEAAYEFLSEGSKVVISKDEFKRRMSIVPFRAYRIDTASCDGVTCTVKSKLTYDHRVMKGITTPMTEHWVIERGKVFYVFPAG